MKRSRVSLLILILVIIFTNVVSAENYSGTWIGQTSQGTNMSLIIKDTNGIPQINQISCKLDIVGVGWNATTNFNLKEPLIIENGILSYSNSNEHSQVELTGKIDDNLFRGKVKMVYINKDRPKKVFQIAAAEISFSLQRQNEGSNNQPIPLSPSNSKTENIVTEKQKALDWMLQNNTWGNSGSLYSVFQSELEKTIENNENAEWLMGSELTTSHKTFYLAWINCIFYVIEIPNKEASNYNIKKNALNFKKAATSERSMK